MRLLTSLLPWNWTNWLDGIVPDEPDDYPLSTCVVSGDQLDHTEMGPPLEHWHQIDGAGSRRVRLCCAGCVPRFEKAPQKYFDLIDEEARRQDRQRRLSPTVAHRFRQ